MARIKPHKLVPPRIVPGDARPSPWLWMLALLAVGLWTWQVYDYGLNYPGYRAAGRADRTQELRERIAELERERDELRFLAAKYERSSQIDREAAQATRGEIKILQNERTDLEREAAFLRTLVTEGGDKLQVTDYSLHKIADDSRYRYRFKVTRDFEGAKKLEGWVRLRLTGEADGEPAELTLAEVGHGAADTYKLGFRHYQEIEGELRLPPDFLPQQLSIDVTPVGDQFEPFTVTYDWAPTT